VIISISISIESTGSVPVPPLSHLASCTPTKSNLHSASSLDIISKVPDLQIFLTCQVQILCPFSVA
jgi:hypothetical protein